MNSLTAATVTSNARRALAVSWRGQVDADLLRELSRPRLVNPADALLERYDRRPRILAGSGAGAAERHSVLSVTAGTLSLAFVNAASSESFDDSRHQVLAEADRIAVAEAVQRLGDFVDSEHDAPHRDAVTAGVIREWSGKSRSNMLRTVAGLDLGPLLDLADPLGMVTLTLPGEWLSVAPDNDTWQRHIRALRKRFARYHGRPLIGLWKKEFQRRGAPHLHVLTAVPAVTPHGIRGLDHAPRVGVYGHDWDVSPFEVWLSHHWCAVVDHQDQEHRARHYRAGTGVDFSKAPFMVDAVSLARYFLKHGTKSADGKEYQHQAPAEWSEGVGRYWGVWGLEVVASGARLTESEGYRVKRVLRRWDRANSAHFGRRRRRSLGMAGRFGSWVLVKDPVRFVGQVLAAAGVAPEADRSLPRARVVPSVTVRSETSESSRLGDVACDICGGRVAQPGEAVPPWAQAGPWLRHALCGVDES